MILRWLLLALVALLVRRIFLSLFGKKRPPQDRMRGERARRSTGPGATDEEKLRRKKEQEEIAAGQRIEEADFEELD